MGVEPTWDVFSVVNRTNELVWLLENPDSDECDSDDDDNDEPEPTRDNLLRALASRYNPNNTFAPINFKKFADQAEKHGEKPFGAKGSTAEKAAAAQEEAEGVTAGSDAVRPERRCNTAVLRRGKQQLVCLEQRTVGKIGRRRGKSQEKTTRCSGISVGTVL